MCVVCGGLLAAPKRKVCGKACRNKRLRQSDAYKQAQARHRKRKNHDHVCATCGFQFSNHRPESKYCSLACSGAAGVTARGHQLRSKSVELVSVSGPWPKLVCDLPASHPAMVEPRQPFTFVSGPCAFCGVQFTIAHQLQARYCSPRCLKKAAQREAGRFLVPDRLRYAIYERDGWKCRLCRKRVGKLYDFRHPLGAVLDHIVPRSLGGSDDPSNLQLAHRICNSHKCAAVWGAGEQLMLLSEVA